MSELYPVLWFLDFVTAPWIVVLVSACEFALSCKKNPSEGICSTCSLSAFGPDPVAGFYSSERGDSDTELFVIKNFHHPIAIMICSLPTVFLSYLFLFLISLYESEVRQR